MATKKEPQINFTLNVSANDLDPEDKNFKVKVVLDFIPAFSNGTSLGSSTFNANKVHRLMTFISERVIKKVIESVYYDRENETYAPAKGLKLPANFQQAMDIYEARSKMKKDKKNYSHLNHLEREHKSGDRNCIECIVNDFFNDAKRPVWNDEKNVTRVIFEQQSPPTLTVESRTIVNGDKRPK